MHSANLELNPLEVAYGLARQFLSEADCAVLDAEGRIREAVPPWAISRDDEMERLGASPRREHVRYVWWIVALLALRREGWRVVGSREALAELDADFGHPEPLFGLAISDGRIPHASVSESPWVVARIDEALENELRLRGTSLKAVTNPEGA